MTELTVIETGEVIEQMTRVEAERITARIADKLDAIADNLEQVLPLIGEALTGRAWEVLGYASPTAYVSERFSGALSRLSPEVRRPVVAQLSAAGMSTRAIAPVVGVSQPQVVADKRAGDQGLITSPAPTPEPAEVAEVEEAPATEVAAAPTTVTGLDGKTYQRPSTPEAPKPKRAPLGDSARDIGLDLTRLADRIQRLTADDRFAANKDEVAARLRHHLANALEVLHDLDGAINQ